MNRFLQWCRRYVSLMLLAVLAFALYLLFFNENSSGRYNELKGEIRRLKVEIAQTEDTLAKYRSLNHQLQSSPELERIAREKYHMQRADEDVYIVE